VSSLHEGRFAGGGCCSRFFLHLSGKRGVRDKLKMIRRRQLCERARQLNVMADARFRLAKRKAVNADQHQKFSIDNC
jgi:hypothetical protein